VWLLKIKMAATPEATAPFSALPGSYLPRASANAGSLIGGDLFASDWQGIRGWGAADCVIPEISPAYVEWLCERAALPFFF
jgi:hypothetical protein